HLGQRADQRGGRKGARQARRGQQGREQDPAAGRAGSACRDGGRVMAPRRPRDIGTAAETAVVRYLRDHGFPHAERRTLRGSQDAGDITGIPGVCWSVKGGQAAKDASDGLVEDWLSELERQRSRAKASYGVLVLQRRGYGPDR